MRLIPLLLAAVVLTYAQSASAQPAPCSETRGSEIVKCVAAAHPDRLAANVTHAQRLSNMQFLRDRVIETARCAGLDVGRNLKRGGPSISDDFLAWRHDGITEGVDIGAAFDDLTIPLRLQWHTYGPPDYGFPTYQAYGPVSCVTMPPPVTPPPPPDNSAIEALQTRIEELEAMIPRLWESVGGSINRLTQSLQEETDWRIQHDDAIRQQLEEVKSRPIPTRCAARGPLGIPIRCELQ